VRARPLASGRTGLFGAAERLIAVWALVGGFALVVIVGVNVIEVLSTMTRPITGRFAGGVELTSLFAAVAAFCFLPYCQLTDANVTADIFTARASPRTVAVLKLIAALVAVVFACVLLWRMSEGMADQRRYGLATHILNIPVWPAYAAALVSLALLVLAALINVIESFDKVVRGARR
jgi:TRAP-type C4-dicarboxylate transport system permease small subunit